MLRSVVRAIVGTALLVILLPPSVASISTVTVDGTVVLLAVDSCRVLVAVDSSGEGARGDGNTDHIFLYTAWSPVELERAQMRFSGHVEYGLGHLVILNKSTGQRFSFEVNPGKESSQRLDDQTTRFDHSIGLSHYYGESIGMDDIPAIRIARDCEAQGSYSISVNQPFTIPEVDECKRLPESCYAVGDILVRFPS